MCAARSLRPNIVLDEETGINMYSNFYCPPGVFREFLGHFASMPPKSPEESLWLCYDPYEYITERRPVLMRQKMIFQKRLHFYLFQFRCYHFYLFFSSSSSCDRIGIELSEKIIEDEKNRRYSSPEWGAGDILCWNFERLMRWLRVPRRDATRNETKKPYGEGRRHVFARVTSAKPLERQKCGAHGQWDYSRSFDL